ncbi:MAG: HD family phosphohydrolase [Bdellovibrio sp.]|jgi:putative nucleotidyltransferase with HDIG domain
MQRKGSSDKHLRENYEDHSLRFLDWTHRFGIERTFLGRFLFHVEEKFQLRRFAFVFLFCLILASALTFEVRTPMNYDVGDVAKTDLYSPVSFEMVDEVTTEEKRVRSEMTVPVIFDFDPAVFERVSGAVYRSFRLSRNQLKNVKWPKSMSEREEVVKEFFIYKGEFEKEFGAGVSDYLFEWLVQNRFSARIENVLIRNLEIWYQAKLAENPDKMIPARTNMVLARTLQKNNRGREFNLRKQEIVDASANENFVLKDFKGLEKSSGRDIANVQALARLVIHPNLTLNKQEISSRREQARAAVLPTTISVKKNQVLVAEGTLIQPFHMALIKEIETLRSESRRELMTFAIALLFLAMVVVFFQYLRRFTQGRVKVENKDILVMGVITIVIVLFTKVFVFLTETAFVTKFGGAIPPEIFLYAAPVAAGPMLVGLLIASGEVVWLFSAFMAIVMGIMTDLNLGYMIFTLASGIAGARGVYSTKKRSDLYWAGVRVGAVGAMVVALTVTISKLEQEGFTQELLGSIPAAFVGGLLSAMVAMMLIPLLESIFNYTTDVKLLELSNLNHPLLKTMIVKAPGTYHHSMLVGSMVEAAAEEIGANPLLGKVMCYYHDIGKMEHANYFIENQKPGQNPHDYISPYMSKTLLVAHVKDGVEMGMNHKLGKPIIDGVLQHHGTTLISFFYNKAQDLRADSEPEVVEDEFRYPGPKPQFREAALCMLADSIEAASRSLDEPTPVRLQNIVRNIVQRKFMEGQLDECSLTLKDLSKVEAAFTRILLGIYHQRIDYPKAAGGGASEAAATPLFSTGTRRP